ncbi:hypothetical protein AGMMS50239_10090 [Bacteroidia bacterium]|nr:hypothetical protein AGMMS50239_10090 [Bacteroidia bacterium]
MTKKMQVCYTHGTEWSITSKQTIGGQYQGTIHDDKASGSGSEHVLTNGQAFDVISTKLNSTRNNT